MTSTPSPTRDQPEALETPEQLDAMRVSELRDFIVRHGYLPQRIRRTDGGTGNPKKADLLRAAKEILVQLRASKSPMRQRLPGNPFQRTTPDPQTRRSLSASLTPSQQPQSSTVNTPSRTPTQHRRPHSSINPQFAYLFAKSPTSNTPTPAERHAIASRPRPSFAPPPAHTRPSLPVPASPSTVPVSASASSSASGPPTVPTPVPQHVPSSSVRRATVAAPPSTPAPPVQPVPAPDHPPPQAPKPHALPVPDVIDLSDEPRPSDPRQPNPHPLDDPMDTDQPDPQPAAVSDYADTSVVDSASDFDSSVAPADSDPGSTVETDDEAPAQDPFHSWTDPQLRHWLTQQGLSFPPDSGLHQLLPIARAHKMYLDARLEGAAVLPNPATLGLTKPSQRRGRIAAPRTDQPDEDDDDDDVVFVRSRPPTKSKRSHRNEPRHRMSREKKPNSPPVTLRLRVHATIMAILAGILLTSLTSSLVWLYRSVTMPYCDTVLNDSYTSDHQPVVTDHRGSLPSALSRNHTNHSPHIARCIPCPRKGLCREGLLTCFSGYVEVGGRCVEDEEFSVYAEALATEAYSVLSDVAGQAECGLRSSPFVTWEEVVEVVREAEVNRPERRFFLSRRPPYDVVKFEAAMASAKRRVVEDESFEVKELDNGELTSNVPTMSLRCHVRRFIWDNLGKFLLVIATFLWILYLRIKVGIRKAYADQVRKHFECAVDILRTHKEEFENKREPYAFVKDVILRADVVGDATRANIDIWKDVEKRLNGDPRVLRSSRTVEGVPSYTYEWAGRRRSSSIGDGLSRRGSFSSRASLDSLDMDDDMSMRSGMFGSARRSLGRMVGRWSDMDD